MDRNALTYVEQLPAALRDCDGSSDDGPQVSEANSPDGCLRRGSIPERIVCGSATRNPPNLRGATLTDQLENPQQFIPRFQKVRASPLANSHHLCPLVASLPTANARPMSRAALRRRPPSSC